MNNDGGDTIKIEVKQEFLNRDSIIVPRGDLKPVFVFPDNPLNKPSKQDDGDPFDLFKKPANKKKPVKEEDEDDALEIQRQLWASYEGTGVSRKKYARPEFYLEQDVQKDKDFKRVAPAKADLAKSKADLYDSLGRHYFLPDAKKHSYAQDTILQAIEEYGDDPKYGFYFVTLPPKAHEYPDIGDVLRVKMRGEKESITADVVKIQGDKDRRQGKRSTSWVVLRLGKS